MWGVTGLRFFGLIDLIFVSVTLPCFLFLVGTRRGYFVGGSLLEAACWVVFNDGCHHWVLGHARATARHGNAMEWITWDATAMRMRWAVFAANVLVILHQSYETEQLRTIIIFRTLFSRSTPRTTHTWQFTVTGGCGFEQCID